MSKVPQSIKDNVVAPIEATHEKYRHYTDKDTVARAREFQKTWQAELRSAGKKYRVDPEAIVGILLVETNLGRIQGTHLLLSVFSSIYVDAAEALTTGTFANPDLRARFERKHTWALGELRALLVMGKKRGVDILNLKGSYAGAFGILVLPSSYLEYAVRAHGDGPPDLYSEADAIHSIAHYLSAHGYRKGRRGPGLPSLALQS